MTLSFELAKELMDAGWQQPEIEGDGEWVYEFGAKTAYERQGELRAYAPSLSELIAAIPTEIDGKKATLTIYRDADGCSGHLETEEPSDTPRGAIIRIVADFEADTLGEGLARLWLKLQEVK